jgi:ethanolamine utilization protein EutN
MLIGEVVGRLWASRQADGLGGRKLLLVRVGGDATGASGRLVVAVDQLGAGPGERVIVAHGSRVRDITVGAGVADKDIVVAIVDDLHIVPSSAPSPAAATRPAAR